MKIFPENIIDDADKEFILMNFFGTNSHKWLFALSKEEFELLYHSYPFLSREEQQNANYKIINSYIAHKVYQALISRLMQNPSYPGKTATR